MSNPNTPTSVEELQAEIDRLNSELAARDQQNAELAPTAAPPNVATSSTPAVREPSSGAAIIGAASDPRGGFVLGYSDGTVGLLDVPEDNGEAPQPWGNAPEGTYSHFLVTENGEVYNFLTEDVPPRVETVTRSPRALA